MKSERANPWVWSRRDVWICVGLLAIGAGLWLPGLGHRGLWTAGEARAGQVARRMVADGDWVTMRLAVNEPRLTVSSDDTLQYDPKGDRVAYVPFERRVILWNLSDGPLQPELAYEPLITIHKPILYYWLMALPARWLNMPLDAFTIRCFSAIPAVLLLPLTYLFGCTLFDRRAGVIAAVALATCVHFYWIARVSRMDMLLALWVTLAIACWYWGYRTESRRRSLACFFTVYVALAAASLLKSFAYGLLVGLILFAWLGFDHRIEQRGGVRAFASRIRAIMRRMHLGAGLIVYAAIVIPWFVAIHFRTDGQYTGEMFGRHMLARAGLVEYGKEFQTDTSWWFYFPRMLADLFPWMVMLPGSMVHVLRPGTRDTRAAGVLLLIWFVVWLVFFSLLDYRKNDYLLPLYPAAMLLVGKLLADHFRNGASDPRMNQAIRAGFVTICVILVLGSGFMLALIGPGVVEWLTTGSVPWSDEPLFGGNENDATAFQVLSHYARQHTLVSVGGIGVFIVMAVIAAVLACRQRTQAAFALLASGAAAMMLVGTHAFTDRLIDPFRTQRPVAEAVNAIAAGSADAPKILLFGTEQHELAFHLHHALDQVPGVLPPHKNPNRVTQPFFALRSRLAAFGDAHDVYVIMERAHWQALRQEIAQRIRLNRPLGDYDVPLRELDLDIPEYDTQHHREPLVVLRWSPRS